MHAGQLASIQAAGAVARLASGLLVAVTFRTLPRAPPSALGSSPAAPADHYHADQVSGASAVSAGSNPARSSAARARSAPPSRAIRS